MPVTKRTRYEVLKRDNFTCRYCRSTEESLKVDHVIPVALGGSDSPDNLVAACHDCNAGKSSTSPTEVMVDDVKQLDLKWAGAIERVAAARGARQDEEDKYVKGFHRHWITLHDFDGDLFPLADNWKPTVRRFYQLGVPLGDLKRCSEVACGNSKVGFYDRYRYFAGCAWRVVTEIQDAAKALLEVEN